MQNELGHMTACAATMPSMAIGGSRVNLLFVVGQNVRMLNSDPQ